MRWQVFWLLTNRGHRDRPIPLRLLLLAPRMVPWYPQLLAVAAEWLGRVGLPVWQLKVSCCGIRWLSWYMQLLVCKFATRCSVHFHCVSSEYSAMSSLLFSSPCRCRKQRVVSNIQCLYWLRLPSCCVEDFKLYYWIRQYERFPNIAIPCDDGGYQTGALSKDGYSHSIENIRTAAPVVALNALYNLIHVRLYLRGIFQYHVVYYPRHTQSRPAKVPFSSEECSTFM